MITSPRALARADLFSAPREGIQRGFAAMTEAADRIATGDLRPQNIVAQMQAGLMVKANAATMRTAGRMLGTLLNTTA